MEIQEIQPRLLGWYRRGCPTDSDYTEFRFQIGVTDGFDSGYNTALKDIKSEVDV